MAGSASPQYRAYLSPLLSQLRMSLAEVKGTREKYRQWKGITGFCERGNCGRNYHEWGTKRQRLENVRILQSWRWTSLPCSHQSPRLNDFCSIKSPLDRICLLPAFNLTPAVLQSPFARRTQLQNRNEESEMCHRLSCGMRRRAAAGYSG